MTERILFASHAASLEELKNIIRLSDSVRKFGGELKNTKITAYVPDNLGIVDKPPILEHDGENFEIIDYHLPEKAKEYYYSGKPYAAAKAEQEALGEYDLLAWLDEDTMFIDQPDEFILDESKSLGYRPVMHNKAGSEFDSPPSEFWRLIYELLGIDDRKLFPTVTQVDKVKIRAYFQAGLLIVRPEKGILRQWPADFEKLIVNNNIANMCKEDMIRNVFLHQNALVGLLNVIGQDEIAELSDKYNYPLFFETGYDSPDKYNVIENIVTVRNVLHNQKLDPTLFDNLMGPKEKLDWLKERLT